MLTPGGGMVALAGTRTLLYIMLGSFPHIHVGPFDPAGSLYSFPANACGVRPFGGSRFRRDAQASPNPKGAAEGHRMMELAKKFWNDDSGQGLAEYALLLGLIVIGVVVFIQGMGGHIKNLFGKANNELTTADT